MPERVQVYGRQLTAWQKDERQDNDDKNDLHVTTQAIYFAHWLVDGWVEDSMVSSHQRFRASFAISCAPCEAPDVHAYT